MNFYIIEYKLLGNDLLHKKIIECSDEETAKRTLKIYLSHLKFEILNVIKTGKKEDEVS